jgi:cyanophycinase
MAEARTGDALTLINLKVHILAAGGRFDIPERKAYVS